MLMNQKSLGKRASARIWKLDSLDLVELIMEFEDRYDGEISDEDAQKILTVGDAVDYVSTHMI